jgi:hypothetical protein
MRLIRGFMGLLLINDAGISSDLPQVPAADGGLLVLEDGHCGQEAHETSFL